MTTEQRARLLACLHDHAESARLKVESERFNSLSCWHRDRMIEGLPSDVHTIRLDGKTWWVNRDYRTGKYLREDGSITDPHLDLDAFAKETA